MTRSLVQPAVWYPTIRAGSGTDVFTERLVEGLNKRGIRAEITWLPLRAEYAPWTVPIPEPPAWANIAHVNSWVHPRFLPRGIPIVTTLHSCVHDPVLAPYKTRSQALYHHLWIKRVEAAHLRRSDHIVAVSSYTKQAAETAFGQHDIEVIYNGVDVARFRPGEHSAVNRSFRLLYVGNWSTLKGINLLAPIMQTLGQDFELVYTADRQGRHKRYSLPPNCRNLGRLSGKALVTAYQQADALLFPSRLEGFGLVAAEAMACGLPVIASHGSALPEIVMDGVTGFLCPQDDVAAFARAIRRLAADSAIWQAMSFNAAARARGAFSEGATIDAYCETYWDAIGTFGDRGFKS